MSIYNILAAEIPMIAYSILHQPKKTVTTKEYTKALFDFHDDLKNETAKIQTTWQNHLTEFTAKMVQTTRGNLSQFLSTPLQSDTEEIQRIIRDQVNQTSDQLLPKIKYGLLSGYAGRYLMDSNNSDLPKIRLATGKTYLNTFGFKISKATPNLFESVYLFQGGANLDILEFIIRNRIGIYNSSHGNKISKSDRFACFLYNLLFMDGSLHEETDRFELQIWFVKGKHQYEDFHRNLDETARFFRTEIHNLNVSLWQRKLGLGNGNEYMLRIRLKDRFTLRSIVNVMGKFIKEKNALSSSLGSGAWFVKEIH
jgi:hypothetical protein